MTNKSFIEQFNHCDVIAYYIESMVKNDGIDIHDAKAIRDKLVEQKVDLNDAMFSGGYELAKGALGITKT